MDISKVVDKTQITGTQANGTSATKSGSKVDGAKSSEAQGIKQSVVPAGVEFVKWSPDAEVAQEAMATAKAAPDTRADKVAHLKAAIKNGTYKVDAHKVADKMIQSSLEEDLLTRKA